MFNILAHAGNHIHFHLTDALMTLVAWSTIYIIFLRKKRVSAKRRAALREYIDILTKKGK